MIADHMQGIEKFESEQWKIADDLRANSGLASNEYFMPLMGLIFLRHATNRFYEAQAAINADKAAGRTPDWRLVEADFRRRRALMLPVAARYDGLRKASGDVFGRIYEYFLAEFSKQGAHDNGEFFTPPSSVQTIVNVIEPDHGIGFDPACGSGGMFVQSSHFIEDEGLDTMKLCRREDIAESLYYTWSKEFLEAGKRRLAGNTARGDQRRGQGPAPGSPRAEGGRRRAGPGIAPVKKSKIADGDAEE